MSNLVKLFGLLNFSEALNADYLIARKVSDEEIAGAVIRSVLGSGSQDAKKGELLTGRESKVADKSMLQARQDEAVFATLIFNKGYTANEVEVLVEKYHFELAAAQAKVSNPDNDTVLTLSIGCAVLLLLEKSFPLSARLDLAIDKQRQILLGIDAVGRDNFNPIRRAVKPAPWRFYRVDVIASENQLATLVEEFSVAAVRVDRSGSMIEDFTIRKQRISQLSIVG